VETYEIDDDREYDTDKKTEKGKSTYARVPAS
jgi:hypothetical protein